MKSTLVVCRDRGEVKHFRVPEAVDYTELRDAVKEEMPKASPILAVIQGGKIAAKQSDIKTGS